MIPFEPFGNSWQSWSAALGLALGVFGLALLIRRLIVVRLAPRAERTETPFDDFAVVLARRTRRILLLAVTLRLGALAVHLPLRLERVLGTVAVIAIFLQAALWVSAAIDFWIDRRQKRTGFDPASATTLSALKFLGKLILGAVLALAALDALGVQVTALIAGLGVGGLALALATQNILADLFASLTILIDKPFVLGDLIQVDDLSGSVESIGLKTTRIRSTSGEQLIFSNGDLLKSRLHNFGRMAERRVALTLSVALDTPPAELGAIPARFQAIVAGQSDLRFDRAHVTAIGRIGIEIELVYFVIGSNMNLYMDRQQAVLLAVLEDFAAHGIALPAPPVVRPEPPESPDQAPGSHGV
ncbi:MAG: mechanosensitive ion channel domain-containing protein [Acidobacteriota bacterium]